MTSEIKYTPTSQTAVTRLGLTVVAPLGLSTLRPWLRLLLDELLKETLHAWMVKGTVTSSNFLAAISSLKRPARIIW